MQKNLNHQSPVVKETPLDNNPTSGDISKNELLKIVVKIKIMILTLTWQNT